MRGRYYVNGAAAAAHITMAAVSMVTKKAQTMLPAWFRGVALLGSAPSVNDLSSRHLDQKRGEKSESDCHDG